MKFPVDNYTITSHFTADHQGLDLSSSDRRLFAISDGYITKKGYHFAGGEYIISRHPWVDQRRYDVWYGHLAHPSPLSINQEFKEGDVLGTMGDTGQTTGVHVHFEVRLERGKVDPELFLDNLQLGEREWELRGWLDSSNIEKDAWKSWCNEWEKTCKKHGIMVPEFKCDLDVCTEL